MRHLAREIRCATIYGAPRFEGVRKRSDNAAGSRSSHLLPASLQRFPLATETSGYSPAVVTNKILLATNAGEKSSLSERSRYSPAVVTNEILLVTSAGDIPFLSERSH